MAGKRILEEWCFSNKLWKQAAGYSAKLWFEWFTAAFALTVPAFVILNFSSVVLPADSYSGTNASVVSLPMMDVRMPVIGLLIITTVTGYMWCFTFEDN